jgi:hypothetical protein
MSSNGKQKRRSYSEQFERDAVPLVVVEGYSLAGGKKERKERGRSAASPFSADNAE